jgi:ketosteroid isomerase-like protein
MTPNQHEPGDFIPYPSERVVGTIADAKSARAAIEALLRKGFQDSEIDILRGEEDLHRLDPTGSEHGFLARFQRTLIRTLAPAEEFRHLSRHVEDLRAGRFVIMVLAKERERRNLAADVLNSHGAEFVGFYGKWAWESLDAMNGASSQIPEQKNMELMQTLDDAWNAQDWDTFDKRHKPDVVVRWPAQPPTKGRHDHRAEAIQMFKTFPDNHVGNRPYKVFFASGDWTCSIARFTGTMKGPMLGPDGKEIPATGRSFEVDFCTVARWENGEIVEENLFYDVVGFMSQIGVGK